MLQTLKTPKFWSKLILNIAILSALFILIHWYQSKELTDKVPSVNYQSLKGKSIKFDDIDQKSPIVVYFWASWCPACKFTSSVINQLSKDYPVFTIALSSGTDLTVEVFLQENGFSFVVINDEEGEVSQQWGVYATPTIFIIDEDKRIVYKGVGIANRWLIQLRLWLLSL